VELVSTQRNDCQIQETKVDANNPTLRVSQQEAKLLLEEKGLIVGLRDPRRNTAFKGAFMVAEPIDESFLPTRGAERGWCIVGDDLGELIDDTACHFLE
jgi:hypothetical protein